ncbi:MAG: S8 family serine peptidase [Pseudomonadota bacterium]
MFTLALFFALTAQAGTRAAVGLTDLAGRPALEREVAALGGTVERCFLRARFCLVGLPQGCALAPLQALDGVRYAEWDRPIEGFVPPPPPPPADALGTADCPDLWELTTIGAFEAWQEVDGTWAPVVAVQDSGFLLSHEELRGRVSGQFDYGDLDTVPEVSWSAGVPAHGTFISGVIAGVPDNGAGRAGVAPHGQLNLQKIADSDGALMYSYAAAAMADLADGDLGVRVLSYSIASSSTTDAFRDAVAALEGAGILLVTAAGNCSTANCGDADNDTSPMYPGSFTYDHIVVVASSTREDGFNSYSHYGANSVDLAAPGEDICSCGVYADDDYYTSGGTSYATPIVAASAALLLEAHPDLTTTELARVLRASAEAVPAWEGKVRSDGRLSLARALHTALPRLTAPADIAVDGTAELALHLEDAAFEGEAWLVLEHEGAFDVAAARDRVWDRAWSVATFAPGEQVQLPDAGTITVAQKRLSVIRGPIATHAAAEVALTLRGREVGSWDVSARAVLISEGADYLNAPYAEGVADSTGFLAWPFQVRVTGVTADTGDPGDTGHGDSSTPDDDSGGEPDGGCGCGGGAPPAWFALLAPLLLRRRRA